MAADLVAVPSEEVSEADSEDSAAAPSVAAALEEAGNKGY